MEYDEYVKTISFLHCESQQAGRSTVNKLSQFLDASIEDTLSLLERFVQLGCPIKINKKNSVVSVTAPDIYSETQIKEGVRPNVDPGKSNVFIFLTVDSTNAYLKTISNPDNKLLICIAEKQTEGRGRRGKNWVSPFGSNLYLSIRKRINVSPQKSGCISLVTGLAIINAIQSVGFSGLKIKWPNDIYADSKKLAGILIEVVSVKENSIDLVIGVGLNVKMPDDTAQLIDQPWVDLNYLCKNTVPNKAVPNKILPSRNQIVIEIVNQIMTNLELFEKDGLSAFISDWQRYDLLLNKQIQIRQENSVVHGKAMGINETGELCVKTEIGLVSINAGEVSVRLS